MYKHPQARREDFNFMVILNVWSIWCERNSRVFQGVSKDILTVPNGIKKAE